MENDHQKTLKKFIARRHPMYDELLPHWEFVESCYKGGREWFRTNIFRYIKEGDKEFKDRVKRAYRFNHTREVVDLVDKYLFKMEVARNIGDASDAVNTFWKLTTLNGLDIKTFMKQVSKLTSIYGRIWIVVDNSKTEGVETIADEKTEGVRTYAYTVTPENVCDMSYDDDGDLNWILIHEQIRDDEDPLNSTGKMTDRFRLWERDQYTLFTVQNKPGANLNDPSNNLSAYEFTRKIAELARSGMVGQIGTADPNTSGTPANWEVVVTGPVPHELGEVPVFSADNIVSHEQYSATSLIDDIAYLDRAVANYLSNLDAIIQDQTFSQLVMPAQGITPGEEGYDKLVEMGTNRIFTYDAEGGGAPQYISPDVKQATLIMAAISKIINEIYHTVGLAGERTKEDNSQGIDNSSGVAKAYDFERVNSLLAAKADSLNLVENKLIEFVEKWSGEYEGLCDEEENLVEYPTNFDVRGLYDEFDIAARLSLIQAPDSVRQKQMESVIDKLFPKLKKDLKDKMLSDLKDWPPIVVDPAAAGSESGTQAISKAGTNTLANKLVKENGGK